MSHQIVENVKQLITDHGHQIKSTRHLLLWYWKEFDHIRVNGQYISTQDFLHKCTPPTDILNAKMLLDAIKEVG